MIAKNSLNRIFAKNKLLITFLCIFLFSNFQVDKKPKLRLKNIFIEKIFDTKVGQYIFLRIEDRLAERQERLSKKLEKAIKQNHPKKIMRLKYRLSPEGTYKSARKNLMIAGIVSIGYGIIISILDSKPSPGQFISVGELIGILLFLLGITLIFISLLMFLFRSRPKEEKVDNTSFPYNNHFMKA